ncbi:hypothetical protein FE840_001430 [Peteryoungia desertarenae]|uniref:Uncharacterized protein n=1 Tax=Peteryoungia desertarenae TaxID=1813451 RepID=A0ABX6QID3_9HYPH|nr:hypothetical protein [Peteryoungia desertarenae]QLF68321.1 hypothetical protein FE840_001430 [Peteryoungia desertarenae]
MSPEISITHVSLLACAWTDQGRMSATILEKPLGIWQIRARGDLVDMVTDLEHAMDRAQDIAAELGPSSISVNYEVTHDGLAGEEEAPGS